MVGEQWRLILFILIHRGWKTQWMFFGRRVWAAIPQIRHLRSVVPYQRLPHSLVVFSKNALVFCCKFAVTQGSQVEIVSLDCCEISPNAMPKNQEHVITWTNKLACLDLHRGFGKYVFASVLVKTFVNIWSPLISSRGYRFTGEFYILSIYYYH